MQEETIDKPGKVLRSCERCDKKIREGDNENVFPLVMMQGKNLRPLPVWSCPECGTIYALPVGVSLKFNEPKIITLQ